MHDHTGFQRDLLFVLNGLDEPNGQEIKAELEQSQGRTIQHGRLYTNLDTLVEQGLVEKGRHDGRTNRYTLTDEGREAIRTRQEWQREYTGDNDTNSRQRETAR